MKIFQKLFMSMKFNKKQLFAICISLASFSIYAQEDATPEALITDRPDQTESPTALPKGFLQVETGGFYESFKQDDIKFDTYTYNSTLIRYGLIKNLELRLGFDFTEGRTTINGNRLEDVTSGFSPLLFGFKTTIAQENGLMPEIGFLGHLYLPFTAGTDYRPETTGVEFLFAFEHSLNENSNIGYNLGAAWMDDSPEASYIYSVSYGLDITDKLRAFVELYGDLPENSRSNHYWDSGLTYLISNNVQLDASVGTSITKGQDIFINAGVSFRIPKKMTN